MPRAPRLDAPDVLHHVMARGLEWQRIFRDDQDREDSMRRLAALAESGALTVYAWVLLPNHFHVLIRTGQRPLSRSVRSLLTGYAGTFNRRYRRSGHLFQNRYKSVVCEDAPIEYAEEEGHGEVAGLIRKMSRSRESEQPPN